MLYNVQLSGMVMLCWKGFYGRKISNTFEAMNLCLGKAMFNPFTWWLFHEGERARLVLYISMFINIHFLRCHIFMANIATNQLFLWKVVLSFLLFFPSFKSGRLFVLRWPPSDQVIRPTANPKPPTAPASRRETSTRPENVQHEKTVPAQKAAFTFDETSNRKWHEI